MNVIKNLGDGMTKIPLKFLTRTKLSIPPRPTPQKKLKPEDSFACILCICMSSLVKGLDIEKYGRADKIAPINISATKRQNFEENYKKALELEKSSKKKPISRLPLPNLARFLNINVNDVTNIITGNLIQSIIMLSPAAIEICKTYAELEAETNDVRISTMFSGALAACTKGLSFLKEQIKHPSTLESLIGPFFSAPFSAPILVQIVKATALSSAISIGYAALNAVDRDLGQLTKRSVEAGAHKAFTNFILMPELNLVKKYPFFKPILFADPLNILEVSRQIRQLYKEHCDAEFVELLKKNKTIICGSEPTIRADNADKQNVTVIDDYVI